MSIALHPSSSRSTSIAPLIARITAAALALTGLGFAAAFVLFLRFFVFEYFHGNPTPLHDLARAAFGS